MPTSPSEDEPDDRFLRDPEDLTGFLQDIDPKAGDRFLPFEPEDGDADGRGARTPFWGAGKASDPSRAGSTGPPEPSEAGDDRVWEALGTFDETPEAGDERAARGDGASRERGDRALQRALEEAPDELESDPDRFWGTGFVPAAGEDELTAGLARLERLMWDGGD